MFKNYLKIAFRNLIRQKSYSIINISGLAIGMVCFILISLWIADQLSYDNYHTKGERIYRVVVVMDRNGDDFPIPITPGPLAPALQADLPEIEAASSLNFRSGIIVKYEDKKIVENGIAFAAPEFFEMFTFSFIEGSAKNALTQPNETIITRETAQKYFGDEPALGKILQVKDKMNLTVAGVIDFPENTHFHASIILPNLHLEDFNINWQDWGNYDYSTYFLLKAGVDEDAFRGKLATYMERQAEPGGDFPALRMQPLTDIYLYSDYAYDIKINKGNIQQVYSFSIIAVLVLVMACINFANLAAARSVNRGREAGLRKTVGARRSQLVMQFLGEAMLASVLALALALILTEFCLPVFNAFTGRNLSLYSSGNPQIFTVLGGMVLLSGLLAGIYPAILLSKLNPVAIFQNLNAGSKNGRFLRRTLVTTQFTISIALIIGAFFIYRQLHFMQNMDLGYNKNHLVFTRLSEQARGKYAVIKDKLLQLPDVNNVTATLNLPIWEGPAADLEQWSGKKTDDKIMMHHKSVDYDFFETFGLEMVGGRAFSPKYTAGNSGLIINEAAARRMELDEPLGVQMSMWGHEGNIIGVVKDFNYDNVRDEIQPVVIKYAPEQTRFLFARITPGTFNKTKSDILTTLSEIDPDCTYELALLDSRLDMLYREEARTGKVIAAFAMLAALIAGLGLYGLAAFTAEQRRKEIGIRKVLGAGVGRLSLLMAGDFTKWVVLANIIAWPAAWLAIRYWLQGFAYRIELSWWIFLLAGAAALLLALLTVSFQSIRAALMNPVETIKYE